MFNSSSNISKASLKSLLILGFSHAHIDFISAFLLFQTVSVYGLKIDSFLQMAILYNLVAFSTQFLVGIFVDKYKNPKQIAIFGLLLSIFALFTFFINPALSIVFIGLSNSFLHIGGGVISIKTTPGRATAPGLFVAPGALGLTLGILYGKGNQFPLWTLAISILLTLWLIIKYVEIPKVEPINITSVPKSYIFVVVGLLLFTISSRSIVGLTLDLPWKNTNLLIFLTATIVVLGKGLGGIVADKYGWIKTGIIALFVSAPLITIGSSMFLPSIIGIFIFQFSMPITLAAIARILPGREGLAFGLTTLVLVFAALTVTPLNIFTITTPFTFLLILASAGTLYVGLELSKTK